MNDRQAQDKPSLAVLVAAICLCIAALSGCAMASKENSMPKTCLLAGTARVEITPPVGARMIGYGARKSGATGVHDPLFARVIVLKDEDVSMAIVAADLAIFTMERIITEAKEKWNLDHVILSATHTHSGPTTWQPTEWRTGREDKIIAAIGEASNSLFPARISWARGEVDRYYMPHNRRFVNPDGSVTMMWDNPERIPTSPVDPRASVLRVDDESGNPRALMVHYACHAVVLGAQNVSISADYPGAMVNHIEKQLGPDCMAMFLQGAAGDIDPFEMNLGGRYGFRVVREAGITLAEGALKLAKKTTPLTNKHGPLIRIKENVVPLGFLKDEEKTEEHGVMGVVLGNELALALLPGEPFIGHQLDLDAKMAPAPVLLLGYSFFGAGEKAWYYYPTVEASRTGGYGAIGPIEPSAGEKMVNEAVHSLKGLLTNQ